MSDINYETHKIQNIVKKLKINTVKMISISGTGHLGGSMSIAEIISVLYFHEMKINPKNPKDENRDRFILSKGHSSTILYAALSEIGYLSEDILQTLHHSDSPLQMHPELGICPGIEMSTGALGQGLSAAAGMAIGAKIIGKDFRVYALLSDGEMCEGQVWEASMFAAKYKLDNLVAIIDYNKFTLSNRTSETMPFGSLYDKWNSFGWYPIEINGHSIIQIINAFNYARSYKGKPTVIIAHTVKGYGIPAFEDKVESHSVSFSLKQTEEILRYLGCEENEISSTLLKMKR